MNILVHKAIEPSKANKKGQANYQGLLQSMISHGLWCPDSNPDAFAALFPKLDGVYVQLIPDSNNDYTAWTRQGEPMPSVPPSILAAAKEWGQPGRVYVGEVWMVGMPHSEINGMARKQSVRNQLQVWLHDSFVPGATNEAFATRWRLAEGLYNRCMAHGESGISLVYPITADVKPSQLKGLAESYKARSSAYDGLILRDAGMGFIDGSGTSGGIFKEKPRKEGDFLVIGTFAGKGKHLGRMGGVVVDLGGGKQSEVGTGFSDVEREQADWIGRVVQVSYLDVGSKGKLREPAFERRRDDKTMATADKLF